MPGFSEDVWKRLVEHIFVAKEFTPDMLSAPEVRSAIDETCRILTHGVDSAIKRQVPQELIDHLHNDTFLFSGFKTYHTAREISAMLLDPETGSFKNFDKFFNEVRSIDERYNHAYLQAEYNFAVQSTQMAVKWHDFEQDGDRYLLQYRTANDGNVRPEHQALHNTTLPIGDPFWNDYTPPLGWNCRCTVVQVRRDKYPESDSATAIRAGEAATAKPKQRIFRFNPGKTERVFPPKHPYLPKGCGDCQYRKQRRLGYNPDNPMCQACEALAKCMKDATIEEHRKAFDELVASGNYTDLEFNPQTGAYKATHINHITHDKPDDSRFFGGKLSSTSLEKECLNVLFKAGDRVILRDEEKKGITKLQLPALDLFRNGEVLDIRSITENKEWTICNGINAKRKQIVRCIRAGVEYSDKACLYFHDPSYFSENKMESNIKKYRRYKSKLVKKVVCVLQTGQIYEYDL